MKSQERLLIGASLAGLLAGVLSGCSSQPIMPPVADATPQITRIPEITRDEVMGPNRARASMKNKKSKEYIFRNIASAFPDTGKNMLLKNRALPKSEACAISDNSPWHQLIYQNPEHVQENRARFSNTNMAFYATPLKQSEALPQPSNKIPSEPFYQMETAGKEDRFEPNNDLQHAYNISNAEDRWLALLGPKEARTEGVQWDEDWYQISVSPFYRRLMVDLRYQHYLGDIDMNLYDTKGKLIARSQGTGEDEFLHLILDQDGTYFIQIVGSNHGNRYDLKYSTYFTGGCDDAYEENDTMKTATDLTKQAGVWLSQYRGEGVAADDDFYKIQVPPGKLRVQVDLRYDVSRGDVDMRLMDPQGKVIASSANIGDDDYIDFSVPSPGIYYVKVYPFAPQSHFNMYDLKWTAEKVSQKEAHKVLSKSQTLLTDQVR